MTGCVGNAPDTDRRCLSQDGRPGQQQAANNGQRRFHVLSIIQLAESSSTAFGFFLSVFGGVFGWNVFVSRADFLEILGRVFVKVLLAIGAAKPDLLTLINKDMGLAHFTEFVAGNGADGEPIWFRRRIGCVRSRCG
jgi:hypothetical protein